MNFAWTECCERDSSLLSDCEPSFVLSLSYGSVLLLK